LQKELAVTCRKVTCCAGVVWLKRSVIRKDRTRATDERATQRVGLLMKNLPTYHEVRRGTKDLGGKRHLYVRKMRATAIGIKGWTSKQLSLL
jgi:hypothetical protein